MGRGGGCEGKGWGVPTLALPAKNSSLSSLEVPWGPDESVGTVGRKRGGYI